MRRTSFFVLVAVAITSPVLAQGTLKNGWHEDTKNGYKLKIPDKWECVPVAVDEKWIVAKYLADKAVSIKKGEYSGMEQKPQLRVIVFSDEARKVKQAEIKQEGTVLREIKGAEIPYKDYKDYIKRNGQDGGFFFDKEKETKVGDMPCWQYEIKFEKLTVPRRVIAWVFRGDAAEYAVEYEVLEDSFDKFQPVFLSSLKTFKLVKRDSTAVGSSGGTTGSGGGLNTNPMGGKEREAWKALSAKERTDRRKTTEESLWARAKEKLPPGWTVKTTPNFLILSHSDAKFVDKVVEAATACRNWLDKNLGAISDEYAMRAVIRVCADADEYNAYQRTSDDSEGGPREIVTFKDANMSSRRSGGFDLMYRGLLISYLADKDPNLLFYSPPWIIMGLRTAMMWATAEGGTLKLSVDSSEGDMLRELAKGAKKPGAKELMESSREQIAQSMANQLYSARLVRYFLASKKDFVVTYLKAAIEAADELTKNDTTEHKEAKTEEEEEAQAKERREAGKKRYAEMIAKVHEKACKWTEKEWQSLEAAFAAAK